MKRPVRIGVDVGGTFTHAVALDGQTLDILGKVKVPTTHRDPSGVARGIIDSLLSLLANTGIDPQSVAFIAHSTTQATNALLEGDVAPVGIIGMGRGPTAALARNATKMGRIALAPGKFLTTAHVFLSSEGRLDTDRVKRAVEELKGKGARAIAVSEAFSVDGPDTELAVQSIAREMGMPATAGSEVSQLYGLKVRTRTAVINASMLPKMIESADMTEQSVRAAGITAPIMIMRSDGGVMDIEAMRRRPIQTMLSGPAAGVAAAMMYLRISDGVFLEVGGTSTDISAIRNGRAQVRSAEIGGHRVYMRTLDVRTVGVAGGSLPRLDGQRIVEVGPRSAHIAGLAYAAFTDTLDDPQTEAFQPQEGDPADYVALRAAGAGGLVAVTPTCASNFLSLVPEGDCARGNSESVSRAFAALARATGLAERAVAEQILARAAAKCQPVVDALVREYKLDRELTALVGGGGGAAAIVPFLSARASMHHVLAENADVVSAIGVALALVRETIERQVINPSGEDILRLRQEAVTAVRKMGAAPTTIEVHVEVDSRANIVRATASGATDVTAREGGRSDISPEERRARAAESMRVDPSAVSLSAETEHFQVWQAETSERCLGGLLTIRHRQLRTVDTKGVIRLQTKDGVARTGKPGEIGDLILALCEEMSDWGDAGKVIPSMMLLAGPKIVDLSGLLDTGQVLALARMEAESLPADSDAIVISSRP